MHSPIGRRALVLSGGGARGAYQTGVLRAVAEMSSGREVPFPIISGISAGAINAVFLASRADDFQGATRHLWDVWSRIHMSDVFLTRPTALLRIGTRMLTELSMGSLLHERSANYLLDTTPLRTLLDSGVCDSPAIRRNLERGLLHAVAVTATEYQSGNAVTFFDGDPSIEPWMRVSRFGARSHIQPAHTLASASLPIFFPPVLVDGRYFGDGAIRLRAPLSTAIHLGAESILTVSIRYSRSPEEVVEATRAPMADERTDQRADEATHRRRELAEAAVEREASPSPPTPPALASILGVLLNALLLDGLEIDIERLERINRTLSLMPVDGRSKQPLRYIPLTVLRPSVDLGELAIELLHRVPAPVRHLLKGLGATEHVGWDLLSYLAFDPAYTRELLALGYRDAMDQRARIQRALAA